MRRWFLLDPTGAGAPIYLGLAELEATIRQARRCTFVAAPPRYRVASAPDRFGRAWTREAEGLA